MLLLAIKMYYLHFYICLGLLKEFRFSALFPSIFDRITQALVVPVI